jgi:hypothetical protein
VSADIIFIRQGAQSDRQGKNTTTAFSIPINALLSDSAALIDLSGAASV